MIIDTIRRLFIKITPMDKANFYTVQAIRSAAPRTEYNFTDCSEGFIALMERSAIPCWVNDKIKSVGFKIENPTRIKTLQYDENVLLNELIMLKKGAK